MTWVVGFIVASAVALLATLLTLLLLRPHLSRLLTEVCGTRARAGFWLVVSLLSIGIVGLLSGTATVGYPDSESASAHEVFLGGVTQFRLLLLGLLGSVLVTAYGLVQAIRSFERRADLQNYYQAMQQQSTPPPPSGAAG